jgi:hypothetical protein
MTTNVTDFNDNLLDDDSIDFLPMKSYPESSTRQEKAAKAGLRQVIDAYLEEKKLKNDLRDIFEDELF